MTTAEPGKVGRQAPLDVKFEFERQPEGAGEAPVMTVFLAGARCPLACTYCDLEQYTVDRPTPRGSLPAQLENALSLHRARQSSFGLPADTAVKLYNASNFFEARAVPAGDDEEMLRQLEGYRQAIVECHPKMIGERAISVIAGSPVPVQVAMGLETSDADLLRRLDKRARPEDFRAAAEHLHAAGASLRVFLLVGLPAASREEMTAGVMRSVDYALDLGAEVISLIPLRPTTEAMRAARRAGELPPVDRGLLDELSEQAAGRAKATGAVVLVDPWDLDEAAEGADA